MFNEAKFNTLMIAVIAMIILTALSRILPFLLPNNSPIIQFFTKDNSPLAPLGGAIIVAMTVILALPFFVENDKIAHLPATLAGIVATIIATQKGMSMGISVIMAMGVFMAIYIFMV